MAVQNAAHDSEQTVNVDGRTVKVTNLDKVLYPAAGFTKSEVIDYYVRIAPVLLPHLEDRPLTLKRYPNGVDGEFFYEKRCPTHRPDWVETTDVWSEKRGKTIPFCLVNDLPTLVWTSNLADLELHTSLSKQPQLDTPTILAFDLDPGEGADVLTCCEVAQHLKGLLESLGLECFAKTSGSKGLQIYAPLNTAVTYEQTSPFAKTIAQSLEKRHPKLVVSNMRKVLRVGKVLVDWSQNNEHKTTICAYSLRAKQEPTVSTPVKWSEITGALRSKKADRLTFLPQDVLARVERFGDLFEPVLSLKQSLPDISDGV
jgi:bifunctional non-homologous end joining protein LigD